MKLNNQLQVIFQHIETQNYQVIADVGTDHGKLPKKILDHDFQGKLYLTDISINAIEKLKQIFKDNKKIICFQADGLQKFDESIDLVVIAGLGTKTILEILNHDNEKFKRYCLQTMQDPSIIRDWIKQKKYFILDESLIENKGVFYHTIIIDKHEGETIKNEEDIYLGPIFKQKYNNIIKKFWKLKFLKNEYLLKLPINKKKREKLKIINNIYKKTLK